MKTYWNITDKLSALKEWQPNCWIQVTCPTETDQRILEEEYGIKQIFLILGVKYNEVTVAPLTVILREYGEGYF